MERETQAQPIPNFGPAGNSIATLMDLAVEGEAAVFRDLASCLGLNAAYTDELWRVARRSGQSGISMCEWRWPGAALLSRGALADRPGQDAARGRCGRTAAGGLTWRRC